jgi:hypothetical protein
MKIENVEVGSLNIPEKVSASDGDIGEQLEDRQQRELKKLQRRH